MRIFIFLLLLAASCAGTVSQSNDTAKIDSPPPPPAAPRVYTAPECSCPGKLCEWYQFRDNYIDLERNEILPLTLLPAGDFKTCTKYAGRYKGREEPQKSISWKGATFAINKKHELEIKGKGGSKKYTFLRKPAESPHDHPTFSFFAMDNGVLLLADDDDTCFTVSKYDESGNELFRTNVQHTHIEITGNTHYYKPYLGVEARLKHELVFTTQWFGEKRNVTVIVDLETGAKRMFDYAVAGIVRDSSETRAAGMLETRNDSLYVFHRFSDNSETEIPKNKWDESVETILSGDLLVLATFHRIATGSSMYCFNLRTKKQEWKADVLRLEVSHSQYLNDVNLALYKNKLILEGNEMGGDYVQLFDIDTGKRLAEFGDAKR